MEQTVASGSRVESVDVQIEELLCSFAFPDPGPQNTNWLAITAGDILRTNHEGPRNQPLVLGTGCEFKSFNRMIN
jgi:hypothetical protein